ncbi:MAG: L,D-transpeptidase [Rhodothermales bacterium]|nr:L,D-transpeptidase [Rhodothermales bacterium]
MAALNSFLPRTACGVLLLLIVQCLSVDARGQGFINQAAVASIVDTQMGPVDSVPDAFYEYYVLSSSRNNTVQARNTLYYVLGGGDLKIGKERSKLVGLLNRVLIQMGQVGDTLVVPTRFDIDFRAYSPFPRYYPGAKDFPKLFIIHKTIQAFAAYESGELVRWGIVNTGAKDSPTPTGRYNFNWKTDYKVSSLSPPDEPWEMHWVFNFHEKRGIHIHQYAMPVAGPASHGCVRLLDPDAMYIYNWADSWKTTLGNDVGSEKGSLLLQGTTVLVVGDDPPGKPQPFLLKKRYPVLKLVDLPDHPFDVPAGTEQQLAFDQARSSLSTR